jgi:hypothetical protein
MRPVYNFFGGRSTFFALIFVVAGICLAFRNELTGSYVGLVGGIQSMIVAHSAKEDYFKKSDDHDEHK